jgi:hypothetical protein
MHFRTSYPIVLGWRPRARAVAAEGTRPGGRTPKMYLLYIVIRRYMGPIILLAENGSLSVLEATVLGWARPVSLRYESARSNQRLLLPGS